MMAKHFSLNIYKTTIIPPIRKNENFSKRLRFIYLFIIQCNVNVNISNFLIFLNYTIIGIIIFFLNVTAALFYFLNNNYLINN